MFPRKKWPRGPGGSRGTTIKRSPAIGLGIDVSDAINRYSEKLGKRSKHTNRDSGGSGEVRLYPGCKKAASASCARPCGGQDFGKELLGESRTHVVRKR